MPRCRKKRKGNVSGSGRSKLGRQKGRAGADFHPTGSEGLDSLQGKDATCGGRWQHFSKVLLKSAKLVTGLA